MIWAVNDMQDQWTHSAARSAEPPGSAGTQLDAEEASRDCPTPWRRRCASASPWGSRLHLVTTATGATAGGKTEGRLLKTETARTLRNRGNLLKVLWPVSPLPSLPFISLPPLCLFISLSLSVCRAASLLMPGSPPLQLLALWLFRREPAAQTQTHLFVMVKVFSCVMSSLPCSMAARTLRFSSVAAAKLRAGRTGSRGSAGLSARFDPTVKGFFWRMLKFGRGFLTLQQTWEKHLGRTLGYWAGWCSRWAPRHRILHKCSSLCRDETHYCSWWTALSTSGLTWYQLISLVTWGQQSETQVQHLTYYRLIGAEVTLLVSQVSYLQQHDSQTLSRKWTVRRWIGPEIRTC